MKYAISLLAQQNTNFRKVVWTGDHSQLVLMSLKPGEEIGLETHTGVDQLLFFIKGSGEAVIGQDKLTFGHGDVVVVPAGTEHNFTNTGQDEVKLYTVYSPAEHPDDTVHATKAEADAAEHAH